MWGKPKCVLVMIDSSVIFDWRSMFYLRLQIDSIILTVECQYRHRVQTVSKNKLKRLQFFHTGSVDDRTRICKPASIVAIQK